MAKIDGEDLVMRGYLEGYTRAKAPKSRSGNKAAFKAWAVYRAAWEMQLVKKFTADLRRNIKKIKKMDAAKKGRK